MASGFEFLCAFFLVSVCVYFLCSFLISFYLWVHFALSLFVCFVYLFVFLRERRKNHRVERIGKLEESGRRD